MNKDEEIGFHKGAIDTLLKERFELMRLLEIVEAKLKFHIESLEKLGVKLRKELEEQLKEGSEESHQPQSD